MIDDTPTLSLASHLFLSHLSMMANIYFQFMDSRKQAHKGSRLLVPIWLVPFTTSTSHMGHTGFELWTTRVRWLWTVAKTGSSPKQTCQTNPSVTWSFECFSTHRVFKHKFLLTRDALRFSFCRKHRDVYNAFIGFWPRLCRIIIIMSVKTADSLVNKHDVTNMTLCLPKHEQLSTSTCDNICLIVEVKVWKWLVSVPKVNYTYRALLVHFLFLKYKE